MTRPNPDYLRVVDKAHAYRYKDNVKAINEAPVAPDCLSPRGKEIFNEFVERIQDIGIASVTDTDIMVLYCKNQEEMEYLERFLIENGHTYTTEGPSGTQYKKYPQAELYNQCKAIKIKILLEFGLSPSARVRVKVQPKKNEEKKNPFAALDQAKEG